MNELCRIVPPESVDGWTKTQGTKVLLPNGSALPGVTRITLVGNADDVWRAQIECIVQPPQISALATIETQCAMPAWKRMVLRWLGFTHARTTEIGARRYHEYSRL